MYLSCEEVESTFPILVSVTLFGDEMDNVMDCIDQNQRKVKKNLHSMMMQNFLYQDDQLAMQPGFPE